ncbi:hypothetical protein Goshw_027884 [Gossypium schwendimanii]|uniref:Remorin C-terminal domain-containing protein n=1 Tax=Gossypium schwendimanii TaxID=34291 RepID=A0A7J9KV24_GOSSC|nr:hypothetical protein [Gossypium schwendimanii]
MRAIEDKGCYNLGAANEISSSSVSAISFEFHKGNGTTNNRAAQSHHRTTTALGKPTTPSKWDDAQKWLVGLSRSRDKKTHSKAKPRNSNADDRRLIAPVPHKEQDYPSSDEEGGFAAAAVMSPKYEGETKKVDFDDSIWNSVSAVRSICVRDMGTEMTPIASQEPSRTTTPLRATTPAGRSPISSGSSTPVRCQHGGGPCAEDYQAGSGPASTEGRAETNAAARGHGSNRQESDQARKQSTLETRAIAWDEAERAKYMARYKREEVKIQAWENHEKRKAEVEMKKIEVKAERLKARAKERYANKVAATRRIAEEKRANAESKLNEKAIRTSQRADYIRRTGHFPSSFSFKLPSLCCNIQRLPLWEEMQLGRIKGLPHQAIDMHPSNGVHVANQNFNGEGSQGCTLPLTAKMWSSVYILGLPEASFNEIHKEPQYLQVIKNKASPTEKRKEPIKKGGQNQGTD